MSTRAGSPMTEALALVAPGQPLREGLDRVLRAKRGALVVVGDGPAVLAICTGGFLVDAEFSPQRLSELAKMDGAVVLAPDASRIARANVHLMPKSTIPTNETGTRHRTAERVARSIDVPVVTVSSAMSQITVYRNDHKHVLQMVAALVDRADRALATLQRFRNRFDVTVAQLSRLEVEDSVSVQDVCAVLQAAEMVARIHDEVTDFLVELGDDGRLVRLQLSELTDGVAEILRLVVRDYMAAHKSGVPAPGAVDTAVGRLDALGADQLVDDRHLASVLELSPAMCEPHAAIEPRGYRLLHRLPRFSEAVIDRVVARFGTLQKVMRASLAELEQVEGVGATRARTLKEGLARMAEAGILELYQ